MSELDKTIGELFGYSRKPPKSEPIRCAECDEPMTRKQRADSVHCPKCLESWYGEKD